MKRLGYVLMAALPLVLCLLLGGCGDNPRATALLTRADSLMAGRPDSALQLLDSCEAEVAAWPESQQMRFHLLHAKAQNKAYVPFTSDSVMTVVSHYYDRHGTNNEQVEAHYLLGCVYRDLGEAPKALSAYHDAVECADTTAADCDYKTLCRVYAQMSDIFYYQNLYENQLASLDRATYYGYLAKDTLAALLAYSHKMDAYDLLSLPDSVLYICETVSELFNVAGYSANAADVLFFPVRYLCDQSDYSKAKQFLDTYERESGFFDENHNIECGREVYYYTKGYYYLKTCQYDSAEYFFRKELATGKDFNNQNAGSRGLALLFQQTHKPDSAAKYALYSYEMNDSVYAQKATEEVAKTKAMYDYERNQCLAQENIRKAERFRYSLMIVCALSLILLLLIIIFYLRHQNEKRQLEDRIRLLRGYAVNERLRASPTAQHFRKLLKETPYGQPDQKDWKALSTLIGQEIPSFHETLNDGHQLTDFENDVCMLIKIQISASDIAKLKQCAPSYITQTRKNIFQKLFLKKGRADELDEYIMSLPKMQ